MIDELYSFILFAAAMALVSGVILLRRKSKWSDYLAWSVILAGRRVAFVALHPRGTPLMGEARKIQESIGRIDPQKVRFSLDSNP